jgi:hypothetical protein
MEDNSRAELDTIRFGFWFDLIPGENQWAKEHVESALRETAGPSTTLRSGRDDNFVVLYCPIPIGIEATSLQRNCHPDRSAA